jgi:hypothetical protein
MKCRRVEMDTNDRDEKRDDADIANQDNERMKVDPASATIIGANIIANNTAPYPGGVAAPGSELAAAEDAAEDTGAIDFDSLEKFGSAHREGGDEVVSAEQSELEADELNG